MTDEAEILNRRVGAPPLSLDRTSGHPTHKLGVDCVRCGSRQLIYVPTENFWKWRRGEILIQHAMPELTDDERECLMTGWCLDCVKAVYLSFEEMEAQMEETCPACGELPDYCQGHGEIGDPDGHRIVAEHFKDDPDDGVALLGF